MCARDNAQGALCFINVIIRKVICEFYWWDDSLGTTGTWRLNMIKRVMAWVLLVGFLFLILNLIVIRFYWQLSMVVYLVIVFIFLFTNKKGSSSHNTLDNNDNKEDRE